mmetsp:Transcript_7271/g.14421  ORF Transcript_7271/g.14421 Transcript_7271/m.14421 type:complete len:422 (+) Transcript_7271:360-1625(+)
MAWPKFLERPLTHLFTDAFLGLDTRFKISIFIGYIFVYDFYAVSLHNAQIKGLNFNFVTAVVLQEVTRLIMGLTLYSLQTGSIFVDLPAEVRRNREFNVHVLGPSLLLALYNNLFFLALGMMTPVTLTILLQTKLVMTAFLNATFLGAEVTSGQWLAIVILLAGCTVKSLNLFPTWSALPAGIYPGHTESVNFLHTPAQGYLVVGMQVVCGSMAGVSLEKLLKDKETDMSLNAKQIVYSFWSVLINLMAIVLGIGTQPSQFSGFRALIHAFSFSELAPIFSVTVIPIIFSSGVQGVLNVHFLCALSTLLKEVAKCIEIFTLGIFSYFFFGYAITPSMCVGILLVVCGLFLFSASRPDPPPITAAAGVEARAAQEEVGVIASGERGRRVHSLPHIHARTPLIQHTNPHVSYSVTYQQISGKG